MPPSKKYPNAEWAGWIQEVANQATENNAKVSQTYCKAAKAIKNHPIKLNHPRDALSLPGVGPKVVKIITDRLEIWCQENQVSFPSQVPLNKDGSDSGLSSDDATRPRPRPAELVDEEDHNPKPRSASNCQKSSAHKAHPTAPSKPRAKKPYQPKPRDPAWGILAAMYTICEPTDLKKFSSREIIAERAARYSDCTYVDLREDTSNRYGSHWQSGIKALIKYEFVITHATLRPAKYALTRTGYEFATVIAAQEDIPLLDVNMGPNTLCFEKSASSSVSRDPIPRETAKPSGNAHSEVSREVNFNEKSLPGNLGSETGNSLDAVTGAPSAFRFSYLNNANQRVLQLGEAATRLNSKTKQSFYKIEYPCAQQLHQFRRNHVLVDEKESCITLPGQETMIGWLKSEKSIPTCPGLCPTRAPRKPDLAKTDRASTVNFLLMSEKNSSKPASNIYKPPEILQAASEFAVAADAHPEPRLAKCPSQVPAPMITSVTSEHAQPQSSMVQPKQAQPKSNINSSGSRPRASFATADHVPGGVPVVQPKQALPKPNVNSSGSRPRASFATADHVPRGVPKPRASIGTIGSIANQVRAEVWKARTYSVMLVIDNREVQSQNNRDGIFHACLSRARQTMGDQVKVQQRPLAVGDAIWIAVHNETGNEVVLDSVVERKRLDDLCKSIVDARFHEQKARLKNSGLKDRIYLVESYYSHNNRDLYEQQIQTSQVEIMLLDDCHLQSTADWKESVEYLVMRTNVLNQLHQTIDLSVIPDKRIDRNSYLSFINELRRIRPDDYWVTSYNVYESLNGKSGNLTVQELWGRMIHQISGMSVEKVGEFVTRWPTPRSFTDEFFHQYYRSEGAASSAHGAPKDCLSKWIEDQFCSGAAHSRKKLGPALSKKIAELFSLSSY
ncbi:Crossover junction endonuclease mus81 [Puccinia graminis f. sp. tritici]|uniref:Crossover junction endonuclease MUS81 n=1 Tax=Puccinia graminis f. sp. tritici TaxID=56615 RepID=A0A5B0RB84_PUCGR|nr:Crossover junction endonuclease mus81 [Puccinia graminis f. sp. tritici]